MTGDTLGGYRLVRKLGEGPRAEVHLAYPRSDSDDARAVAIKVFRPTVGDTAAITEIEALEQKKTRKVQPRVISGVKSSSSKKAGSSVAVQKGARGGARQVSRSGRVRTGQKHAPKK